MKLREFAATRVVEGIGAQPASWALIKGRTDTRRAQPFGAAADMDALPILEETASTMLPNAGRDARLRPCNGHTAMAAGRGEIPGRDRATSRLRSRGVFHRQRKAAAAAKEMVERRQMIDRWSIDEVYAMPTGPACPSRHFAIRPGPSSPHRHLRDPRSTGRGRPREPPKPQETMRHHRESRRTSCWRWQTIASAQRRPGAAHRRVGPSSSRPAARPSTSISETVQHQGHRPAPWTRPIRELAETSHARHRRGHGHTSTRHGHRSTTRGNYRGDGEPEDQNGLLPPRSPPPSRGVRQAPLVMGGRGFRLHAQCPARCLISVVCNGDTAASSHKFNFNRRGRFPRLFSWGGRDRDGRMPPRDPRPPAPAKGGFSDGRGQP